MWGVQGISGGGLGGLDRPLAGGQATAKQQPLRHRGWTAEEQTQRAKNHLILLQMMF